MDELTQQALSRQVLLNGQETPPPERVELRAGPLTLRFEHGDLRFVRYGDREVIRRIYVAVRDPNWRTAELTVSNVEIEHGESSFRIAYAGLHRQREIDFDTRVVITGDENGTLTFDMHGVARSTFWRGRIGVLVLYPGAACAGRPFTARTPNGKLELGTFPKEIGPHQPVHDLVALTHEVVPGLMATVRFYGDVFEMEDQRNWTDATYKVYSTPLRLPAPVEVQAGTRIRQRVELDLVATGVHPPVGPWPPSLALSLGAEPVGALPPLGVGMAGHGGPLSDREQARLRALNLAHLRVDLELAGPEHATRLRDAHTQANVLGVPLEIALHLTDAAEEELAALARLVGEVGPSVRRWLVFHVDEPSTTERWARLVREHLARVTPDAPIGGGANAYFTQLNRGRPPVWALDFVCYSINPQVHAFDDTSLMETLPAQAWTVESARAFALGLPIVVSPVTLKPRFNASAHQPEAEWETGERNSPVDARQTSLFGAAWTLGSVKFLAESGVASVTYYETTGRRGVMEIEGGSPPTERFRSLPGAVFPLYHVLADVGELAGADVLPLTSTDEQRAVGLALRSGARTRLLLANLTPETQRVRLDGLPGRIRVRRLDETTALRAMREPEAFRAEAGSSSSPRRGALTVELLPASVARLEA